MMTGIITNLVVNLPTMNLKGVPVRLAIGPRDLENKTVEVARRDNLTKEIVPIERIIESYSRTSGGYSE